jgi:hypothetical protein
MVPRGHSSDDGQQVLFTVSKLQTVREHAQRVGPIGVAREQLGLSNGNDRRRS